MPSGIVLRMGMGRGCFYLVSKGQLAKLAWKHARGVEIDDQEIPRLVDGEVLLGRYLRSSIIMAHC